MTINILSVLFKIWGCLWFALLIIFLFNEIRRNCFIDPKIRKDNAISKKEKEKRLEKSKKSNINTIIGLDKKTFIALAVNNIIIAITFLTFIEVCQQNDAMINANNRFGQILQEVSNKLEKQ